MKPEAMTPEEVFRIRSSFGDSQTDFARRIGYRESQTISCWERGAKVVPNRAAVAMRALAEAQRGKVGS